MMRRVLIGMAAMGALVVPAACGSDSDGTDVTTPDVTVADTLDVPGGSTVDTSLTGTMDPTLDTTMSGSDGTVSNDISTTP